MFLVSESANMFVFIAKTSFFLKMTGFFFGTFSSWPDWLARSAQTPQATLLLARLAASQIINPAIFLKDCIDFLKDCTDFLKDCIDFLKDCIDFLKDCKDFLKDCIDILKDCADFLKDCIDFL